LFFLLIRNINLHIFQKILINNSNYTNVYYLNIILNLLDVFHSSARSIEKIEISNGKIAVKVKNGGNKHFIAENISVLGSDSHGKEIFNTGTKGWYVLAGSAVTFEIELPEEDCYKADNVKVSVEAQGATMGKDLVLDSSWCASGKEGDRDSGGKTNR